MITIDRKSFASQFETVASVTPNKTPKDILKNVKCQSDGTTLCLSASDSEIHIRGEIPYVGDKEVFLLPADRMLAILREVSGELIKLTIKEKKIRVQCGSADYELGVIPVEDFPDVPTFDADSYYEVESTFRDCIRKTEFSIDPKSTRYCLAGIQLELSDSLVTLASTDSRRLSMVQAVCKAVNNPTVPTVSPVVPTDAMKLVGKTMEDGTTCFIACRQNDVAFRIGSVSITAQIIQGRFPDYRKVIPADSEIKQRLLIPVGPFASLMRQVRVMESAESHGVDLLFSKGKLTAMSRAKEIGNATADIPLAYDADDLSIAFGGPYVAELLKVLDPSTSVEVCLLGGEELALFVSGTYKHVIMPLAAND